MNKSIISSTLQLQLIAVIRQQVAAVLAIYRFGTWATPYERADSDIDLAFLGDSLPRTQCWAIAQELARIAGRDVDLIDMRRASTVMQARIIAEGERIYCSHDNKVALYECHVFSDYARLNEERRDILNDIKAGGSVYGG